MNENLKVYLLSAILVLSGITLKRLESAGVFNIKNIAKYNAEEVVEDEIRNNSRGDLFSINAAANYEENLVIPIITTNSNTNANTDTNSNLINTRYVTN